MDWKEISVYVKSIAVDAVSEILESNGAKGVIIEDPNNIILKDDQNLYPDEVKPVFNSDNNDMITIKVYYPEDEELESILNNIKKGLSELVQYMNLGEYSINTADVKDEDWANEWKKYYKPFKISNGVVIKPTWEEYDNKEGLIVINLDPGMAFGTGTHESTRMCANFVEKYLQHGDTVFDVGCGSGILGIIAAKLGASSVEAIDIDNVAVGVAKENIQINNVENLMKVEAGILQEYPKKQFNIVVCNIVADVILGLAADVRDYIKEGGLFITSGIIKDREKDILNKFNELNYVVIDKQYDKEWVSIVVRV